MYITEAELEALVEREWMLAAADVDRDGVVDTAQHTAAIEAAQGEIDGYLAARYSVPLADPVPAIIGEVTGMLAIERLAARHPALPLGPVLQGRTSHARRLLEEVSSGRLSLPAVAASRRAENTEQKAEIPAQKYEAY